MTTFVGKSIRQHQETLSGTWWRTKGREWWLTVCTGPFQQYHWLLTGRGAESWSGFAHSLHEAEQQASACANREEEK